MHVVDSKNQHQPQLSYNLGLNYQFPLDLGKYDSMGRTLGL